MPKLLQRQEPPRGGRRNDWGVHDPEARTVCDGLLVDGADAGADHRRAVREANSRRQRAEEARERARYAQAPVPPVLSLQPVPRKRPAPYWRGYNQRTAAGERGQG